MKLKRLSVWKRQDPEGLRMKQTKTLKQNRKAQIEVFIILGLFILAVIIFAILLQFTASSKLSQITQTKKTSELLTSETFHKYVQSCIDNAFYNGVETLAKGNGYIYAYGIDSYNEPILYPVKESATTKIINVSYGITASGLSAPYYPNSVLANQTVSIDFDKPYYTGDAKLRSLDDMKFSLRRYVLNATLECVNLSKFDENNVNVTSTKELDLDSIKIDFGDKDTTLTIDWPLRMITKANTTEISGNYVSKANARLLKMHEVMSEVLDQERVNFNCIINNTYHCNLHSIDPSIAISNKINIGNNNINKYDNLLEFTDAASKVNGKPLTYYVGIKNRLPALDYVGERESILRIGDNIYDYVLVNGETAVFNLSAKDPDDDVYVDRNAALKYSYECCSQNCNPILQEVRQNNQAAFYIIGDSDTVYCVRAIVSDEANAKDWQDIKIFVSKNAVAIPDLESCDDKSIIKLDDFNLSFNIDSDKADNYNIELKCSGKAALSKPYVDKSTVFRSNGDDEISRYIAGCEAENYLSITVIPNSNTAHINFDSLEIQFRMTDRCS